MLGPFGEILRSVRDRQDPPPVVERGAWVAMSTGQMWSVMNPLPEDVDIRSIAAGLSRQCRYGGQLRDDVEFYSVAEHCVLMTEWARDQGLLIWREDALKLFLHDASEAYCGDMPSPAKEIMPEFKSWENLTQAACEKAFGLDIATKSGIGISKEEIKAIDRRIRIDERKALILDPALSLSMERQDKIWPGETGLGVEIQAYLPSSARKAFLDTFKDIMNMPLRYPELEGMHAHQMELTSSSDPQETSEMKYGL